MKKLFLLLALIGIYSIGCAQRPQNENEKKTQFRSSFDTNFTYLNSLVATKASIFAVILVSFNGSGKIKDIKFSDGAPPKFISEIIRIKDKVDFKSMYDELGGNTSDMQVLIPVQIDALQMAGGGVPIAQKDLDNMYLFKGQPLTGEFVFYPAINYKYHYNNYE